MNGQEPVRIVCASNKHFVVMLAALIKSIEKNNRSRSEIHFYLIEDRIPASDKTKLEKSISQPGISIRWIPLDTKLLSYLKFPNDHSTYPKNIYSRLLIDHFIPSSVKKVIYLDSDMMLNTDIANLWQTDLEGYVMGAVQEPNVKTMDCPWSGVKNYRELEIPAKAKYFNSGLMLIDMDKWRAERVGQKVVECVEKNKRYAGQPDQYGLNVVLWNKWKELDPLWNHYADRNGEKAPHNIHFVIRKPIYTYYNGLDSYRQLFYAYLNETPWQNFKPIGEFQRKLIKVNNMLEKIF